jgi:RHS repeat-associated protein
MGTATSPVARLFLIGTILLGPGANAADLGTVVVAGVSLKTQKLYATPQVKCNVGEPDPANGVMSFISQDLSLEPRSPGLFATPIFNGANLSPSPWGRGWSSDLDHFLLISSGNNLTWQDGLGNKLVFLKKSASNTLPIPLASPISEFSEMRITALSPSGAPISVQLRDTEGTVRLFTVAESSSVLRLSRLTDRNGNTVDHTRSTQGRLTRVEDIHGRFIDLTYTASGQVKSLADSGGRTMTYTYDSLGRRTSEIGPEGTISYQYDAANRLTKIIYPTGAARNYTYDSQDRVTSQDDGNGQNRMTYVYESSRTTVTDALNHSTVYDFIERQGLRKVSRATDAQGGVTTFAYDTSFNLVSQTDPLGRITHYTYDQRGNITQVQDARGGLTSATYEATFNQVTRITDPLNRSTDLSYDEKGNPVILTDALNQSSRMSYGTQGHLNAYADPLSNATQFTYNPSNGSLASIIDPLSRQTTLQTDALNRVFRNTDPAGKQTQFEYDAAGNLTKVTNALTGVTRYTYAPGRDTELLTAVKDALGHETTFAYDVQGRMTSITNALGQTKSYGYDAQGRVTKMTNARGQATAYTYDSLGRLTSKMMAEGTASYGYDGAGNLTTGTNYNGSSVEMVYDSLDQVIQNKQTLAGGFQASIGYVYDANGNRTQMTTPWGNFNYQYDTLNRLTTIINPQSMQFRFEYDSSGRRTRLIYPNGVETAYTYDQAGQPLSIIHSRTGDNAVIGKSTYSYDAAGNRTQMTDLTGTHNYSYDDLHRLVSANHPPLSGSAHQNELFTYDATGNRLADAQAATYSYDAADRLLGNSSYTYVSDASGSIITQTKVGTGLAKEYTYDSSGKLVGIKSPSTMVATYKYSPTGKRWEKNIGGTITRYVYDGENLLATLDSNNALLTLATQGLEIDSPMALHTLGRDYFPHADALGSVVALTDEAGTVVETIAYEAFGRPRIRDAGGNILNQSAVGNIFFFTAREFDAESDLYYFRARYFDQFTGRFIAEDPIGLADDVNLFVYAQNNPTAFLDPLGTLKLKFDGSFVYVYDDDGKMITIYGATSGMPGFKGRHYQRVKEKGATPEGQWYIYPTEVKKLRIDQKIKLLDFWGIRDWGDYLVPLHPAKTNTYGRTGIFLHNGRKNRSWGCVKILDHDYEDLFKLLEKQEKPIPVEINYQ